MPDGMNTKRSKLLAVSPDLVEPSKPKVLVYGGPGVGKTWWALSFPSVFYCDTEGGADLNHYREKLKNSGGVYFGPDQGSLDFETVIGQVRALATERHPYKTVVFDSISKLWNVALSEEQERLGDADAFGAFKKQPTRQAARLVNWVNRLDMNAVFIAHRKDLWGKNDKGQREVVGDTFDGHEKLEYDLHLALSVFKTGPTRRARIGKSRLLGFPEGETFEWTYENFAQRYGKDVIEKEVKQIVIATPEQVAEVQRLLGIVKVPDDWADKCFKKAKVESWDEMDSQIIEKVIVSLKEKLS